MITVPVFSEVAGMFFGRVLSSSVFTGLLGVNLVLDLLFVATEFSELLRLNLISEKILYFIMRRAVKKVNMTVITRVIINIMRQ